MLSERFDSCNLSWDLRLALLGPVRWGDWLFSWLLLVTLSLSFHCASCLESFSYFSLKLGRGFHLEARCSYDFEIQYVLWWYRDDDNDDDDDDDDDKMMMSHVVVRIDFRLVEQILWLAKRRTDCFFCWEFFFTNDHVTEESIVPTTDVVRQQEEEKA